MTFGIRTWSDTKHLTLNENAKTIRQTALIYIPSGSTGSVALSDLPSGIDGVYFMPTTGIIGDGVQPFTWISGGRLYWRGSSGNMYLCVMSDNQ